MLLIASVSFYADDSRLVSKTEAGTDHCGAAGDYVNWKEANWTLHSKARIIEMDSARGPCRRESKVQVFRMAEWVLHSDCMQHCQKLGGRSPPVRTFEEWKTVAEEVQHIVEKTAVYTNTSYQALHIQTHYV